MLAVPGRFPGIDAVASDMAMSTRTLRRRLAAENRSFQEILDEVRFGLAKDYLQNSSLPIEQVADLLAFSAAGNFSQAFKRWSGVAPRDYRSSVIEG